MTVLTKFQCYSSARCEGGEVHVVQHPLSLFVSTYSVPVALSQYNLKCIDGVKKSKTSNNKIWKIDHRFAIGQEDKRIDMLIYPSIQFNSIIGNCLLNVDFNWRWKRFEVVKPMKMCYLNWWQWNLGAALGRWIEFHDLYSKNKLENLKGKTKKGVRKIE